MSRIWIVIIGFILAAIIVIADQYTKSLALEHLFNQPPVEVLPFFNLVLVFNSGAAFGFLNNAGGWQNMFFIVVAAAVGVGIIVALWRIGARNPQMSISLSLILGGAMGNVIDRFRYGYVVDFIDVYYNSWHWPAFNVADAAITIGAVLLVMDSIGWTIFGHKPEKN